MSEKKEKLPNSLTSKENLPPPNLIKNPKERRGRDIFDIKGEEFFNQFEEVIEDLKKADIALQIFLRKKMLNLDETVSSAREKINERMGELEKTLPALRGRGFIRDPKIEYDDIDNEFEEIMTEDKDRIETELEYLKKTYLVLGHLLRTGMVSESDAFIKAVKAVSIQIKKFKL